MKLALESAVFLRRYKRFLADVKLKDGSEMTVHCPNSGSMKTLLNPGVKCQIIKSPNPNRKYPYTLTTLNLPKKGRALVDTQLPNQLVYEAILAGDVPELGAFSKIKREVPYGVENKSRIDILLTQEDGSLCYIEIKNCTMLSDTHKTRADFPDSVTTRGQKHLRELGLLAHKGIRAVQFFLVSRTDCNSCGIADYIDKAYADELRNAMSLGVEVIAYNCSFTPKNIKCKSPIPFVF
ncbi:MAG: DNA/RNA nuclease SfsA [Planctomycetes bacterium]|nr:DNA/RNA nuclease SfsA [Planctomycetota bacterium]